MQKYNNISINRFSVAPMLGWTDQHCNYFHRRLSTKTLLHTEMITTNAILYSKKNNLIEYNPIEQPIAIQLAGSNPRDFARCAKLVENLGYSEININIGCPSNRVQNANFGACLMTKPHLVVNCILAIKSIVDIPVTVKTRIGVDNQNSERFLMKFISTVSEKAKCKKFTIHAREAWLNGLNPKENRNIPPLNYSKVYQLKKKFPHLIIILNGGIKTLNESLQHLKYLDGVMIGREAYKNPYMLSEVEKKIFNMNQLRKKRYQIIEEMYPYIEATLSTGGNLGQITRHMLGLFKNKPGSKYWRRYISENAYKKNAGIEVIQRALKKIQNI
ncbi:tRNA-dihydrouridine synthase [Candidatus Photodesmus katoptron]|uniref:tRNA dihydrouridine(20/20a) synthase DusA n=1 Tax=Candidatus Photodesmus anomalopis TaxID=28176 RepID=UPI0004D36BC9|nr:tRNA dihydrouridine(20/20a) synthase DusA [Candidatus Photodesmus katoptron]KEY90233.1 tRNA-dihydrouridine synthase [Candidatus Photodesmus katoptron]